MVAQQSELLLNRGKGASIDVEKGVRSYCNHSNIIE